MEYLVDAYIKLEGAIADKNNDDDIQVIKEKICIHVCEDLSCTDISCQDCPFNDPLTLTLKNLELVVQEEYTI